MTTELLLITFLLVKHFIADFPLQPPYFYKNKGTYGHKGGLLHAWTHFLGTYLCFVFYSKYAVICALVDGIAHYHIDWAKVKINKKMGWGPTTHEQFWWLMGFDQLLHALTYVILTGAVI